MVDIKIYGSEEGYYREFKDNLQYAVARLIFEAGRNKEWPPKLHFTFRGRFFKHAFKHVLRELEGESYTIDSWGEDPNYGRIIKVEDGNAILVEGCLGGFGWTSQPAETLTVLTTEDLVYEYSSALKKLIYKWLRRFCVPMLIDPEIEVTLTEWACIGVTLELL